MNRLVLMSLVVAATVVMATAPARASSKLADKGGCAACHAADKKVIGPSYREIAAKYKGRSDAAALMAERVRKGGQGVWGAVPMPPTGPDRLNDAELKAVISWLLKTA
jgi:cytochrome c